MWQWVSWSPSCNVHPTSFWCEKVNHKHRFFVLLILAYPIINHQLVAVESCWLSVLVIAAVDGFSVRWKSWEMICTAPTPSECRWARVLSGVPCRMMGSRPTKCFPTRVKPQDPWDTTWGSPPMMYHKNRWFPRLKVTILVVQWMDNDEFDHEQPQPSSPTIKPNHQAQPSTIPWCLDCEGLMGDGSATNFWWAPRFGPESYKCHAPQGDPGRVLQRWMTTPTPTYHYYKVCWSMSAVGL